MARALKVFLYKGASMGNSIQDKENGGEYIQALETHASSLETLYLDLYLFWENPFDLSCFPALKRLITGAKQLGGRFGSYKLDILRGRLPRSLEHLTSRADNTHFYLSPVYQLVLSEELPHLIKLTCFMSRCLSLKVGMRKML
ncbi:uncharacterized protein N7529_009772 [Penicillium soppii]|jgi:hypothetical protein|uniref:uncharacterized protein n=1 Tax=Penicillium soppii TaxID=69789 RepID=UPI0025468B43|nr:uncharacterized protein N7529_009772 [Penicillium soppii]KAJ5855828.1 hypothetical protein N7529_009772 [Penicillium soppii]